MMLPNHDEQPPPLENEQVAIYSKKKASTISLALAVVSLLILAVVSTTVSKPPEISSIATEPTDHHRQLRRSPNRFLQSQQEGQKLNFDGVYRINTRHEESASSEKENLLLRYFRFFEEEQQVIEITTRSTLEEISSWFYPDSGHEHIYTGNYELSDDNRRITFSTHNQYDGRLEPEGGGGLVLKETSSYAFYTGEVYSFIACTFPPPPPTTTTPDEPIIKEPTPPTNPTPEPTPPPYWEFTDTATEVN